MRYVVSHSVGGPRLKETHDSMLRICLDFVCVFFRCLVALYGTRLSSQFHLKNALLGEYFGVGEIQVGDTTIHRIHTIYYIL